MAKKGRKKEGKKTDTKKQIKDSSKRYAKDFLTLRNAIIDNCRDCIRDCGRDCLNSDAKPIENIRCSLQKVRMEYGIIINDEDNYYS